MPSRQIPPPPLILPVAASPPEPPNTESSTHHRQRYSPFIPPLVGAAVAFSILIFLAVLYRKLSRKRTAPADLKTPHRFSYSVLRRATSSFAASNRLGQGGFGSVYRGTLPSGQEIAVKLMDSGSLQGEREFQNELSLAGKIDSDHVVSLLGFSSDRRRRRMLLVYELMHNRSLQDALLDRKCPELMEWKKRIAVAIHIAKGLEFLHTACDPLVIHGDIKPSNILLDCYFSAKIADFGLARLKTQDHCEVMVEVESNKRKKKEGLEINGGGGAEDNGSIIEEAESVITGFEEANVSVDQSPESFVKVLGSEASPESFVKVLGSEASPETFVAEVSPSEILDKTSVSEGYFDKLSVESGNVGGGGNWKGGRKKNVSSRDWWRRQDNGEGPESGRAKDYVMEWIGTEKPKSDWIAALDSVTDSKPSGKSEKKKQRRRLEWWTSLDEERVCKKEKNRPAKEWWKEEFCEELTKKKNKKKRGIKSSSGGSGGDHWWQRDDDFTPELKKKKSRSRNSRSSVDWWLDGLNGEFRNGRRKSLDWASGEIPKSGGVSSTPSMRGTVCYIAPEYSGGGQLSEKCDIYSFGVLLLVLISGRRPLQVTASPMSEFERANLISWARHLAQIGKLLDLVDPSIQSLDREHALICITVALLCLQRSPARRPTMKEVVGMLSGDSELPLLPFEFSPSPPSSFPFKSRKKVW